MSKKTTHDRARRWARRALVTAGAAVASTALLAGPAKAEFGIQPGFYADAFDAAGEPFTQAGGYAYESKTSFTLNTTTDWRGETIPDGNAKDILVDLPAGTLGNPQAVPTCTTAEFQTPTPIGIPACPVDSQVGVVELEVNNGGEFRYLVPLFNVAPADHELAAFQFMVINVPIRAVPTVRTDGDYGLKINVTNINETVGVRRVEFALWGVPADAAHDPERGLTIQESVDNRLVLGGNVRSTATPKPFFINPTTCDSGRFTTVLRTRAWLNPAQWLTYSSETQSGVTGCDRLKWQPTIRVRPDVGRTGAPTGLSVDIDVPQPGDVTSLATPPLKKAVVQLPEGVRVSPSSADGLGACSDEQIGIGREGRPSCPSSSNLGTVKIDTPLLAEPLTGNIFLGTQTPQQLLRLYIVAEGRAGLVIKLPGKVDPNPVTGQLLATFDNNPQLPFSRLSLHFKGGPRAALSNPVTCGVKTTTAQLTAWSGHVANPSDSFVASHDGAGAPCPPLGFTPGFQAGTTNAAAGADSTFSLTFSRDDDDQELRDVTVDMPRGLLARIASVNLCGDAQAAAGTCGEGSRIGSVTTAAGPGTNPFYLPGRTYITGPYKGAPYGMSIVVPAVAGPFNLGTVVVRAAIFVDRYTTELRIVSDPMPSILMGIPLQVRSVNVSIDRQGFMFNPTSCNPMSVNGAVSSIAGAIAGVRSRFQVGDCGRLPFQPRMALRIGGRRNVQRDRTTPLDVTLTMPRTGANLRSVDVILPLTMNARLRVLNQACTLAEFNSGRCSDRAKTGSATAYTPLLRDPLKGPAYFVRNPARRLPDLMVALRGEVDVDLTGKVRIPGGRQLGTNFDTIPDVPISRFELNLVSGAQGVLGNVRNMCSAQARKDSVANVSFRSQGGRLVKRNQKLQIAGCPAARRGAARAGRGNRSSRRAGSRGRRNASRGGRRTAARGRASR